LSEVKCIYFSISIIRRLVADEIPIKSKILKPPIDQTSLLHHRCIQCENKEFFSKCEKFLMLFERATFQILVPGAISVQKECLNWMALPVIVDPDNRSLACEGQ